MRFHSTRNDEEGAGLPLTSLIDVVFLLLIFFMVTSTLSPSEATLASGLRSERAGTSAQADLQPQVIRVETKDGSPVFRLGERIIADQPSLTALLRELPREAGVFVRPEPHVPVAAVAAALQACKDAGFTRVSYVVPD